MAVHPVIIEFLAKGIPDVSRAMRGVEQAAAAHERAQTRTSQRESAARKKSADDEARMKIRAMMNADRWQRQAQDRALRETERMARQRAKAEEKAERDMVRSAERAANDRVRIARQVDREIAQMSARRERENNRILKEAARQEAREARVAARAANDNARARERFVGGIVGAAGRGVAAGVGRIAGAAAQTAGIVGQLGGGFSIADSVQRTVGLKGKLADIASRDVDLSPEGRAAGKDKRKSVASLEGSVRGVAVEFGIEADKGADALDKFASKTGDLQKGLDMLRGLGELSRAGAGDLDDLADAAGDIFNADKTQSAEQVLQKLRQFALQGQKGAVEMKDLASQMAKIGAAAGMFEGGADKNLATMGALAQLARESGGAASAREATTAVSSLSNQFSKNARIGGLKNLGVEAKTAAGNTRPVDELLMEAMLGAEKKSRASGRGMQDFDVLFGGAIADAQARKATKPLEKAFKAAGGGQAGIAAAKAELAKFGAGGRDLKSEFAGKAADRMQEDDAKLAKIREDFDRAVSGRVLPALMKLVPEFERLVPVFVDLNAKAVPVFVDLIKTMAQFAEKNKDVIESIAAHPIGAIMAAEVTKSIAAASLGEVVKKLLMSAFPGGGGGGGGPPGGGGGPGGVAAPAVGVGLASAYVVSKAMLGYEGGKEQASDIAAKVRAWQSGDRERGMSPEQAQAALDAAKGRLDKHGGTLEQTANLLTSPVVDASDRDYKQYKADQGLLDSEELRKALAEATRAMRENTAATRANGGSAGAAPQGNSGPAGAARGQSFLQRP